ncbi:MAG: hypothetical protein RLZZ181_598 [Pseudomonadota bacterium]
MKVIDKWKNKPDKIQSSAAPEDSEIKSGQPEPEPSWPIKSKPEDPIYPWPIIGPANTGTLVNEAAGQLEANIDYYGDAAHKGIVKFVNENPMLKKLLVREFTPEEKIIMASHENRQRREALEDAEEEKKKQEEITQNWRDYNDRLWAERMAKLPEEGKKKGK